MLLFKLIKYIFLHCYLLFKIYFGFIYTYYLFFFNPKKYFINYYKKCLNYFFLGLKYLLLIFKSLLPFFYFLKILRLILFLTLTFWLLALLPLTFKYNIQLKFSFSILPSTINIEYIYVYFLLLFLLYFEITVFEKKDINLFFIIFIKVLNSSFIYFNFFNYLQLIPYYYCYNNLFILLVNNELIINCNQFVFPVFYINNILF